MKICKVCGARVDTNKDYCPLCYGSLFEESPKTTPEMFSDETEKKTYKRKSLIVRIFFIISIVAITICTFINVTTKTIAWSVIIDLSIGYLWVLVAHTIMSHETPFKKIFFQVFSILSILFAIERIFSEYDWFTGYVFPAFSMLVLVVLAFIIFCSKKRKEYIFGIFIVDIMLLISSAVLLIFKLETFKLLNEINLIVQSIVCLCYILFAGSNIWTNLCRRIHL